MAKNVVSFPQGKLMEVAKEKGVNSKNALHDRTGVDRKTIQAMNEGRPIKKSTAQKILDEIRVPLEHVMGKGAPDVATRSTHNLDLAPADGKSLRRLLDAVSAPDESRETIEWKVNLDKFDGEIHSSLLEFKKQVLAYIEFRRGQSLEAQLSKIQVSEQLESIVQNIHERGARVFAGSWVKWRYDYDRKKYYGRSFDNYGHQSYFSCNCIIFVIEPKTKTSSRAEVNYGRVPPRRFDPPDYIDRITVDDVTVWSRDGYDFDDDDIPF